MGPPPNRNALKITAAGQKILKSLGQKNSWKQINQFQEKSFFCIFSIKIDILLSANGKYPKKICVKIDSSHFTSFLAWTFLIFLAHCVPSILMFYSSLFGNHGTFKIFSPNILNFNWYFKLLQSTIFKPLKFDFCLVI